MTGVYNFLFKKILFPWLSKVEIQNITTNS